MRSFGRFDAILRNVHCVDGPHAGEKERSVFSILDSDTGALRGTDLIREPPL